jgi:septal ring factor EnvC (AmiA/AmiB activator)
MSNEAKGNAMNPIPQDHHLIQPDRLPVEIQLETLRGQITSLRNELAALETLRGQIADLRNELAALRAEMAADRQRFTDHTHNYQTIVTNGINVMGTTTPPQASLSGSSGGGPGFE